MVVPETQPRTLAQKLSRTGTRVLIVLSICAFAWYHDLELHNEGDRICSDIVVAARVRAGMDS